MYNHNSDSGVKSNKFEERDKISNFTTIKAICYTSWKFDSSNYRVSKKENLRS